MPGLAQSWQVPPVSDKIEALTEIMYAIAAYVYEGLVRDGEM